MGRPEIRLTSAMEKMGKFHLGLPLNVAGIMKKRIAALSAPRK